MLIIADNEIHRISLSLSAESKQLIVEKILWGNRSNKSNITYVCETPTGFSVLTAVKMSIPF
jgi:hypothetical protein